MSPVDEWLLPKGDGRKARQLLLLQVSDRKESALKQEQLLLRVSDRKEFALKLEQLLLRVSYRKELALELVTFRVIVWRREIDDDENQTKSVTWLDVLNRYVEYSDSFKNLCRGYYYVFLTVTNAGTIIAERHQRLYDYYAFLAVNSAVATMI